ncbi:ATP-binding cassette domain-containing protein [Legionella fallonii]|uniref:ABC transporter ATP-binding protein Uup n=1 Tax=Legionella fallonii LLAP-10 TaxID=1212491 RepID=A0A098G574_9GAMM|nr:ATP-binding cassette domain-containing protein [Legionella fallonii]CEG57633.1 ABC transporter ATP-binding protein Uup [Legionella fallonii LLAP-10]
MSRLIQLIDVSLYFNEKLCFEEFNYQIHTGERIALIGDNGSGKSSMLKIIKKLAPPSDGLIHYADDLTVGYVPQLIDRTDSSSGAERFNQALTQALAQNPQVLLLDEPTNHLDQKNRRNLMRLLEQFCGTLIIASHDVNLLRNNEFCFWNFNQQKIELYQGYFDHYQQQMRLQRDAIETRIEHLKQQKKQSHLSLMKEQQRAKNSRLKGEKSIKQAKWPTIVSKSKMLRSQETEGKKKRKLAEDKEFLVHQLQEINIVEEITPQFELSPSAKTTKALVTITEGVVSYEQQVILKSINLNITGNSRLAICGANGSGKSTLLKAIMGDTSVKKEGLWITPAPQDIGYLDQHYQLLTETDSVLDTIEGCRPEWTHAEIRHHLNHFLFRKNEQVHTLISQLSGGEKARLTLAKIAAKPPKLLILDELTNNLDFKTRNHVITLLKNYPGPFIVVSHDNDFLHLIDINGTYLV